MTTMQAERRKGLGFLSGLGEMGMLTSQFDWGTTSIGGPDRWPQSLRATVSTLLSSRFPMFLWWGEELIQFYNDAYRPSLGVEGKHPLALGQKGKDCWPEIWSIIYPLIQQVLTTGVPTWSVNQLVPIFRNGGIEDVYWTFGYSAVRDDEDRIAGVLVVCTETTEAVTALAEQERARKELEESEQNLRNIILQAPVAMCLLKGPDHVIEVANDSMIEIWGKNRQAVMGKPVFDALPDAREQGLENIMDEVYRTGVGFNASELPVDLLRFGKLDTVYQNFVYEPYRGTDGAIAGVLAVSVDVTEQVQARHKIEEIVAARTKQLESANKELKRSNADLAQFAYIASHDLQEPIRKVGIFTQMLQEEAGGLSDAAKTNLNKITRSVERMRTLVRDVLTFSQLAKETPVIAPVDLQTILDGVMQDFELLLGQKGAKLECAPLPAIEAIPLQMSQLFSNLLSNSLKFARKDAAPVIRISCSRLSSEKAASYGLRDDRYIDIVFEDNGIGFNQENAEQVFHIFQRLHRRNEYEGTGIGLALCKKITENHNGIIFAQGEEGKGAIFHVILPVKQRN